jgi:hypothetical protein
MRDYRTINMVGAGDFIASVSGSSGDYDLTLDNGFVFEGYDNTADTSLGDGTAPAAGDLCIFGALDGNRSVAGQPNVVQAATAAIFFAPADAT